MSKVWLKLLFVIDIELFCYPKGRNKKFIRFFWLNADAVALRE